MSLKKFISVSVALFFISMYWTFFQAYAAPQTDAKSEETKAVEDKREVSEEKEGEALFATSPHVILIDMKNGCVLYEKKADTKVYPASLTKIMTAVLALENGNLEEVITASEAAISNVHEGDSNMGIKIGEKLSMRQLLYGMLLSSAADAANVIAEHVGGSMEKFSVMMNNKAKELGMNNTNFINPVGDHDERHYTTARDMAKLTIYAMKAQEFRDIVKCDSYKIPATEKYQEARTITNGNHLVSRLRRGDYFYKYATGIKTGYTSQAKSCIAASAEKNGIQLLALVFKAQTIDGQAMSFVDCINMFDYVFDNYVSVKAISEGTIAAQTKIKNARRTKRILLKTESPVVYLRDKTAKDTDLTYEDNIEEEIEAPVKEGEVIGYREYFVNDVSVGKTALVADKNYKFDILSYLVNKLLAFVTSVWMLVLVIILIIMFVYAERRRRKILRMRKLTARRLRSDRLKKEIENMK